jgi:GT2 family glycosyltransferase
MKISIVIPCRNEAPYIEECIEAIYACQLPAGCTIEVFVVDGLSDDGTRETIRVLQKKYLSLHIVDNEKQLTPYAFNLGIHAGGKVDYVQIIGARHIVTSNYLMECLKHFERDSEIWCVGGRIVNEFINDTGRTISIAMGTPFGMGLGNFRTLQHSGYTDTVTSPMYPYWVFEKIGFFDETLIRNQDDDFNYRVEQAGGKIYFEHSIALKYYVRATYSGLWRQFFQYGYWKVFVNKKHKAVTTLRQLVPPLFVLYLFGLLVALFSNVWVIAFSGLPFLFYVLLLALFSVMHAESTRQILGLAKTYAILHLAYGLGYLKGIVDFFIFKKDPSDRQKRLSR